LEDVRVSGAAKPAPPLRRLITVEVRDGDGKLLPGYRLDWRENGKFRGNLTSDSGVARLEPARDNTTIEVDIDYPGQAPQHRKLAVGQTTWTFTYPTVHQQPPPTSPPAAPATTPAAKKYGSNLTQIIVALIGLVGVLAVGYWQFGPKPETPLKKEVTLTIYVKNQTGGTIHGAQVKLERSTGAENRGADDNGVALFTVATGALDAPTVVVSALGFQTKTQGVPAIDRDTRLDVVLDPVATQPPPQRRPSGSTTAAPAGTWQVQTTGDPSLRRITAGTFLFSPQSDGRILLEGSITLDGATTSLRGTAGRQNAQLFLDVTAERNGQSWRSTGTLEVRPANQMSGHLKDAATQDVPFELKRP
jgi:hypothetical protein